MTPRWSFWRHRARARSCCRPTPSHGSWWPTICRRSACSPSPTTALPTARSVVCSRSCAPRSQSSRSALTTATATRCPRRSRRSRRRASPFAGPIGRGISASPARRPRDAGTITGVSAAPLDPVYLIGGSDRPKVQLAVRRLRARVRREDGSVEEFTARRADDDGEGMSAAEAAGACNALGLFGGTRLMVIQGAEVWGDEKKAAADLDALTDYLASPAPDAVLALLTSGEV